MTERIADCDVVPVPGADGYYQVSTSELIKLFPPGYQVPGQLIWEFRLLRRTECAHVPRAFSAGYDEALNAHYYRMDAGSPIRPSAGPAPGEPLEVLSRSAVALASLHDAGVAYRPSHPMSLGLTRGDATLLYDFSRAVRFGPDRMVDPPRVSSALDPPESKEEPYDGVRADIFSVGMWCRELCVKRAGLSRVAELLDRMTADSPRERPSSMQQVCDWLLDVRVR